MSQKIFSWLSAPDPSSNFNTARDKRQPDTGIWFLKSQIFLTWKMAPCSFLWLHDKAGSGKTILSSTVIHTLLVEEELKKVVVYFYFDFQTREKQLLQSFLSSVILQLVSSNNETLRTLEDFPNARSCGAARPAIKYLKATLRLISEKLPTTYLIIDALDECEDRDELLESLEDLRSWNQSNLHVLATSRLETNIEDSMTRIATAVIPLEESVVDKDILSYIRHQLRYDRSLSKWSDDLRVDIEDFLLKGANGMFRWIVCQLDALRGCLKPSLLRKTLRSLPKTLDETYARILDRVPEEHVEDVHRILCCLTCSFHPLDIREVADVVAIMTEGDTYYNVENQLFEPRAVITLCSGLVSTAAAKRVKQLAGEPPYHYEIEELRLAHFSVKEYLFSGRTVVSNTCNFALEERLAHETLAKLSICYLMQDYGTLYQASKALSNDEILSRSAFAPYAASSWFRHLREAQLDKSSSLYCKSLQIITDPQSLSATIRLHGLWSQSDERNRMLASGILSEYHPLPVDLGDVNTGDAPSVYYASLLGLDHLVYMLLDTGEDANSLGPQGACLAAAAFCGHLSTAELLLEKGAGINTVTAQRDGTKTCKSRTALHCAIEGQQEEMVTFLLAKGADVNTGRSPSRADIAATPLQTAVFLGNYRLVELLVGAGADANADSGLFHTPLELAACCSTDDPEMIKILLETGADPNMSGKMAYWPSPLAGAVSYVNLPGVELLVKHGADLKKIDSSAVEHFSDILGSEQDYISAIELLMHLRPNANVDIPLILVAKWGYTRALRYILHYGARPNFQDSEGNASIHVASFTPAYKSEVIKIPLDAHADVNIHGGPFGSALQAAALSGNAEAVRLLLQAGASINCAEGKYGAALKIAQDRLEDQKRGWPDLWGGDIDYYGPKHYLRYSYRSVPCEISDARKLRNYPDHAIQLLPHADFQAVIDLLLPLGAIARSSSPEFELLGLALWAALEDQAPAKSDC